jgi:UDP-N-acetylmuramoyl-tripeptide--D-alanyl-D-alanine ligase
VAKTKAEILTFGFNDGADLRASDINLLRDEKTGWPEGLNFKVSQSGHIVPVFLPGMAAEHLIYSALAGLAVGSVFGVNLVEGAQALAKLRPIPGHMRLLLGIKHTLIIDDSYNSSPAAATCALATLAKIPARAGARKFAVLGDMLELGPETANAHQSVGQAVAQQGVDYLITVGSAAKFIGQAAQAAGLNSDAVASFSKAEEAGRFLQEKLKVGDIVLIKGSRGIHLEKVVKEVMEDPLRDDELLVDH